MPPAAWDVNYKKLKEYAQEHGNCNIPFKGETRSLAKWSTRLKNNCRKNPSYLSHDQKKQLEDIGFDFSSMREKEDQHWNSMFQKLVKYKNEHGTCTISTKCDKELFNWVSNQRKIANQNKLRKDRKDILNKIGFVWSTIRGKNKTPKKYGKHDELWDQMYEKLTKYKEENGHCLVPYNYKDSSFGMWVSTQRRNYHKKDWSKLNERRKKLLEEVGFEFNHQCLPKSKEKSVDSNESETKDSAKSSDEESSDEDDYISSRKEYNGCEVDEQSGRKTVAI